MSDFEIRGANELAAKLKLLNGAVNPVTMMDAGCQMLLHNIKTKQMAHQSGPPLPNRITARNAGQGLEGSLGFEVETRGVEVIGHVGVRADMTGAKYGKLHEEGGSISYTRVSAPWWIPRQVTAKYPPRPYLKPGLADEGPRIFVWWNKYVDRELRKAGLK